MKVDVTELPPHTSAYRTTMNVLTLLRNMFVGALALLGSSQPATKPAAPVAKTEAPARFVAMPSPQRTASPSIPPVPALSGMTQILRDGELRIVVRETKATPVPNSVTVAVLKSALAGYSSKNLESPVRTKSFSTPDGIAWATETSKDEIVCFIVTSASKGSSTQ